jgi:hypothetical protein
MKKCRLDTEAQAEGRRVGSGGATMGVGAGVITTGVRSRGNATGARPSAGTTIGQLIRLVAAQSEHMAQLETQVERVADGLERQMGWIGDQLERITGVLERAEGWSALRGNRPAEERPRNGLEWRRVDQLSGPLLIIE